MQYLTLEQASKYASDYANKHVTVSNVSYLIQYGKLQKFSEEGKTLIKRDDLIDYYRKIKEEEEEIKKMSAKDVNWDLSFSNYKESERTKHVHRLHPYKGKFIPQLVEYFLDNHVDQYKNNVYFNSDDILLDPFCGSGTTLVQANELDMHAIGIDISPFNAFISNCKVKKYCIETLKKECTLLKSYLKDRYLSERTSLFEAELKEELNKFNSIYFPPDFKRKVLHKLIDEKVYGKEREGDFNKIYDKLLKKYDIEIINKDRSTFLGKWFLKNPKEEIHLVFDRIKDIKDRNTRELTALILSRTTRSCRATTHRDLATLKNPVYSPYYCQKHKKICKPIFTITDWFNRYCDDSLNRISQFESIRTNTYQKCIIADSRNVDIIKEMYGKNHEFADYLAEKKFSGIFSSPPYVGMINYHEQHAYSYELFGFERNDESEIGPLYKGKGKEAKEAYVEGISDVLINCKKYLKEDYNVFLVANDKFNLYGRIAEKAHMKILNIFKRPVLNRAESGKGHYSESIFYLKEK